MTDGFQALPGFDTTPPPGRVDPRRIPKSGIKATVYNLLSGDLFTDDELIDTIGRPANSVRPRRIELVQEGLVEDSGIRRPSKTGTLAIVWRAVT